MYGSVPRVAAIFFPLRSAIDFSGELINVSSPVDSPRRLKYKSFTASVRTPSRRLRRAAEVRAARTQKFQRLVAAEREDPIDIDSPA